MREGESGRRRLTRPFGYSALLTAISLSKGPPTHRATPPRQPGSLLVDTLIFPRPSGGDFLGVGAVDRGEKGRPGPLDPLTGVKEAHDRGRSGAKLEVPLRLLSGQDHKYDDG